MSELPCSRALASDRTLAPVLACRSDDPADVFSRASAPARTLPDPLTRARSSRQAIIALCSAGSDIADEAGRIDLTIGFGIVRCIILADHPAVIRRPVAGAILIGSPAKR